MRTATRTADFILPAAIFALLGLFAGIPIQLAGQTAAAGDNAVYNPGSTFSTAFIDASALTGTGSATDICAKINAALGLIPTGTGKPGAAVIDARGITTPASLTCPSGDTPWSYAGTSYNTPSTILLPPATVYINTTWVMPDRTQLVGAGKTLTTISVGPSFSTVAHTPLIQMGNSALCPSGCTDIGISDLRVDGLGNYSVALKAIGIQNENAQDGSFVSHVALSDLEDTALDIENTSTTNANNSGPYTDLEISAGGTCDSATCKSGCTGFATFGCPSGSCNCSSQSTATACVKIIGAQTRGIHSFTCTAGYIDSPSGSNNGPNAGIYLDSNSNTVEDGHFEGVKDGIVVGDQLPTGQTTAIAGNFVTNITGASNTNGTSGFQDNVVHICTSTSSPTSPCLGTESVSDLALSGIQSYTTGKNAILDDETVTTLPSIATVTSYGVGAGIYILGESSATGYSRFSTFNQPSTSGSTSWPVATWGYASDSAPPSSGGCAIGSFFSNASGTSTPKSTIYVCIGGTGGPTWSPFK
jgi:hypothetical protein